MRARGQNVPLTRRKFIAAGAVGSAAIAVGCHAGKRGDWEFLSDDQARTLAAICDQIVPADEFPSASQAGAVNYIDLQLTRHYRRHRDSYTQALEEAQVLSCKRFGQDVAALPAPQQFEIVSDLERENPHFFELVRSHTMEGYYGSPRHGGNKDSQSWRMLGLAEPPVRGRAQYDLSKGAPS
jgi:gluconate 2-dehydrogenase gamma chain